MSLKEELYETNHLLARIAKSLETLVEQKDKELDRIIEMIKELLSREVDVYLNVNNHYEGSAPLTIEKIKKLLGAG